MTKDSTAQPEWLRQAGTRPVIATYVDHADDPEGDLPGVALPVTEKIGFTVPNALLDHLGITWTDDDDTPSAA